MSDEPMSIDAAAAFVDAMDAPAPVAAEPKPEAPVVAAEPEQEIVTEPVEAEAETVAGDGEGEEQAEADVPAVEAPQWWDAEAKAHFAALTPEAQAVVKAQEDKREAVVQKVKTEAKAAALAEVKPEVERLRTLSAKLASSIPDEIAEFNAKHDYDPEDLQRYAREDPAGYLALQAQIHAERTKLEQKIAVKAEADRAAQEAFVNEQAERLSQIAPDLAKDPTILTALGDYLPKTGIPAEALKDASAEELVILNKARLYDEMMAKAAAKPVPAPVPKPQPAKIAPQGNGRPASSSTQRAVQETRNRLAQTRSIDDAAELIAKLGF